MINKSVVYTIRISLLAATMYVSGCGLALPTSVKLENRSSSTISDVRIELSGYEKSIPTLSPGEVVYVRRYAREDSSINIKYKIMDNAYGGNYGYITPKSNQRCIIKIEDTGPVGRCENY